ncbi:MAG: hypothetical protein J6D08_11345 [Lachnospiraceae bacterium]|nr:hypothetical protein [Lachnospiraceae bacterium]
MAFRKGYIFTNKEHPEKGIMSTILGILSIVTFAAAVYLSYLHKGQASDRYGAAGLLAAVFMIVGLGLGIWSFTEKDKFKLFPVLGIVLNIIAFGMLSLILYAGAYVN